MMKPIPTLAAYLTALLLTVCAVFALNASTPQLSETGALPGDIQNRVYALTLNPQETILHFRLADGEEPPVIITSSSRAAQRIGLLRTSHDLYRHVYRIVPDVYEDEQGRYIEIRAAQASSASSYLLGGEAVFLLHFARLEGFSFLILGMHLALLLVFGSLYMKKRSESYLPLLLLLTGISAFSFLLILPNPIFSFSHGNSAWLNYSTSVIPLYIHFLLCVGMTDWKDLPAFRCLTSRRAVAAASALLFLSGFVLGGNLALVAGVVRWGSLLLIGILIARSPHSAQGARLVLLSFAFSGGIGVAVNLIKDAGLVPCGEFILITRLSQFGRAISLCLAALDVSARFSGKFEEAEMLSEQLNRINASLDKQVMQRTAELMRKDEQKRQFMLNTFHDLRSPILISRNCIDSIRQGLEVDESLDILDNSIHSIGRMTEDLFLSAKLEDNQLFLVMDKLDLSALCRAQLSQSQSLAANTSVTGEIEPGLTIWGDSLRVAQIIQNLMNNALQHTPAQGFIRMRLHRRETLCVLEIENSGEGIAPDHLPLIFNRYYRAPSAANRQSTGLGLSIAQDLVMLHQGTIRAESTPGEITRFTVCFPAL